jgi:hypothetical protein
MIQFFVLATTAFMQQLRFVASLKGILVAEQTVKVLNLQDIH